MEVDIAGTKSGTTKGILKRTLYNAHHPKSGPNLKTQRKHEEQLDVTVY